MVMHAAHQPAGTHVQDGVNGARSPGQAAHPYAHSQTPVPLPNYTPQPVTSSNSSALQKQAYSASPAKSSPLMTAGQHRSPPVQHGTLNQGPSQSPMQNGNAAQTPSRGLVSPVAQNQPQNAESLGAYQALIALVERAPDTAVRQVVRDRWEKSLLGSEYHIAFVLNATMHQASPDTIARAVKEFGVKLVQTAKNDIVGHLSPADVDELADSILARASPQFLDKALARRLETIPARQLVNALARAERLGYDVQDIVRDHDEQVIPSMHSMPTPSAMPPTNQTVRVRYYQPPAIPSQQLQEPQEPLQPISPSAELPIPEKVKNPHDVPFGPPDLVWCNCSWPCASRTALEYHKKKSACYKIHSTDVVGRDVCLYCGCRFGSGGGLLYHEKSHVCGEHSRENGQKMLELITYFRTHGREKRYRASAPPSSTPRARAHPPSTQQNTTVATPTQFLSTPGRDPYSHLTPDALKEFNTIMHEAEEKYGGLMRDAMLLEEPERSKRLASLKNSYNTKQSTTRKKFGIRLRERRTRDEIEADQARLLGSPRGNETPTNGTPAPSNESRPKKKPRTDNVEAVQSSAGMNNSQGSPQKRVRMAEMGGGLSGSQATAQLTDPTAHLNPPQPRYTPQKLSAASSQHKPVWSSNRAGAPVVGSQEDPMSIDDDDSDTDSDSDDDSDIPATLY
ncbi:hypothetical protein FLONG3_8829 [Fusarium longipes]|uniref:C2H2-type domain-containing protein n=1 Tax=Fusarium longipes TaxID=694270 RepID=A0A395S385_9HYPO|nr:hypothetical protein FLONG3_8829 [Fusarium longipes]